MNGNGRQAGARRRTLTALAARPDAAHARLDEVRARLDGQAAALDDLIARLGARATRPPRGPQR